MLKDFIFVIEGKKFVLDQEFYVMRVNETVMHEEMGFLKNKKDDLK